MVRKTRGGSGLQSVAVHWTETKARDVLVSLVLLGTAIVFVAWGAQLER